MTNLIMQANSAGAPSLIGALAPMILIFILFWFLLIRPQTKRMKEHQAMLGEIKRGDKVVTSGGIVGKVTKVSEDNLTLDLPPNGTKIQVRRSMIADVINPTPANDRKK